MNGCVISIYQWYLGKRRYDRKQKGYGGQTKPVFHKKVCDKLSCVKQWYFNVVQFIAYSLLQELDASDGHCMQCATVMVYHTSGNFHGVQIFFDSYPTKF